MREPPPPRRSQRRARAPFSRELQVERENDLEIGPDSVFGPTLDHAADPVLSKLESLSYRTQSMLLLGVGGFATAALWALLVLPLGLRTGLALVPNEYIWPAAFLSASATLYGALRLFFSAPQPTPSDGDHFGDYLRSQQDHDLWRLRILAAMGGAAHAMLYSSLLYGI